MAVSEMDISHLPVTFMMSCWTLNNRLCCRGDKDSDVETIKMNWTDKKDFCTGGYGWVAVEVQQAGSHSYKKGTHPSPPLASRAQNKQRPEHCTAAHSTKSQEATTHSSKQHHKAPQSGRQHHTAAGNTQSSRQHHAAACRTARKIMPWQNIRRVDKNVIQ